jgi:DNA polymerase-3 subunit epsilon
MSFDDSLSIDQWRKEGRAICQDAVGLEMYSNRFCNGSYIYYTEEQTRPATSEELDSWRKIECQKKKKHVNY